MRRTEYPEDRLVTKKSALLLRRLLGPIRLSPEKTLTGRRYLRAETTLETLPLIEIEPATGHPEAGSNASKWWTRAQSIRTVSEVVLKFPLVAAEPLLYQRIAPEVAHLQKLGINNRRIGIALGVDDKTVAKAHRWSLALR